MDSRENKTECVPSDALFGTSAAALDPNANAELVKQFAKSRGNRIARNAVTSMDVMALRATRLPCAHIPIPTALPLKRPRP